MERISQRVYWLPPGPPDRPSLCAVAGERRSLMLDAGASAAHARLVLNDLAAEGVLPPARTGVMVIEAGAFIVYRTAAVVVDM